jgi:hypothetical protein
MLEEAAMNVLLSLGLTATLATGALGAGDLTITFDTKAKAMMGSGRSGTEVHYYTTAYQMTRGVETKLDNLVDYGQGITYSIDHKKKTIDKISFDDALAALDALKEDQAGGAAKVMAKFMGDPNDVKVEKLGTEQVAGRTCQGWHIQVGKLVMDMAADPSLRMPVPDATYTRMMRARAAQFAKAGPMGASWKRLYEELSKIKGVPLKTHMSGAMGMDVTSVATRIETTPIPATTFNLPDGYKMTDMGKQLKEQMAKAQ